MVKSEGNIDVTDYFPTANEKKESKLRACEVLEAEPSTKKPARKQIQFGDAVKVFRASSLLPRKGRLSHLDYQGYDENIPLLHRQPLRKPNETELQEFVAAGIKIRCGRFSSSEKAQISANFKKYADDYGKDYAEMFSIGKRVSGLAAIRANTGFLPRLAHGLSGRHIWYIYLQARKICHPGYRESRDRFSEEDINRMLEMHLVQGKDYKVIAQALGRTETVIGRRLRYYTRTRKGPVTGTDMLQLIMCICDINGLSNVNAARRLKWREINWCAVHKMMDGRSYFTCQDMWLRLMLPDCMSPNRAQLYFLCSLIRAYATEDDADQLPWDQLAFDVGLVDGHVARRYFFKRKFVFISAYYPKKQAAAVPLRKAAKLLMRVLERRRIKVFQRFMLREGDKDFRDIPQLDSIHNMSWENRDIEI